MKDEPSPQVADRSFATEGSEPTLDILEALNRQRWLIIFSSALGLALGVLYAITGTVWYETTARILINPKSSAAASNSAGTQSEVLDEDILANHMEILRSRKIVASALEKDGLMDLPSIQAQLTGTTGQDAADLVIKRLEIVKGGSGAARSARSLNISFAHTDPAETQQIVESILVEYQQFITGQLESVMLRTSEFIRRARDEVGADLRAAEQEYLVARKAAPILFQGPSRMHGEATSSNVYQEKYRRVEEELLAAEIEESSLRTRLQRVQESLAEMGNDGGLADHLDKLALIDSDSLQRLGLFAGLQINSANTADFQAAQPARIAEAQAQFQHVLELMSEKQRLTTKFGPSHPQVQDIEDQIKLVQEFLAEKEAVTSSGLGIGMLTPESLLKAYIGFLNHDLAALRERKGELEILAKNAETQAKALIDFELQDMVLRAKVSRQEALFDAVVMQLRQMDTAGGLSGYVYELLETPRLGVKSWPSLPLCGLGGLMLGLFGGLCLAVANDVRDARFRSAAELETFVQIPMLGRIGKVNSIRSGIRGLIATELTPDAEAIRMTRTLLLPDIRSGKFRTLGITSPMQGDGKSTVVSNLAVSFSQLDLSVLVIDADLRRPSVHRYFSSKRDDGLSNVLSGDLEPVEAIRSTKVDNVWIMPAGSPTTIPAELLQSEKFDQLLGLLQDQYDVVLLDLPPVLAVSDPLIAAPKLGGVMMVVRAATTRKSEVYNTLRRLKSADSTLAGCVLNTFGAGKKFNSDGGYFGYYNSSYTHSGRAAARKVDAINGAACKIITSRTAPAAAPEPVKQ